MLYQLYLKNDIQLFFNSDHPPTKKEVIKVLDSEYEIDYTNGVALRALKIINSMEWFDCSEGIMWRSGNKYMIEIEPFNL